ncbi:MAG: cupin domain-containing protein [Acidobacteria bacterium]|nr:MAG: cupin domain-containing protein [Acidobacteriota bacterium]
MGIVMEIPSIDQIDRYVARLEDRQLDWGVLDFQARVDPKYRRAQMRYVGGGGTGQHDDPNIIKAGHFTLSTMVLPPGHEGPLHLHTDVEELFFVLEGTLERTLGPRDLVWIPAGIWRGVRNDGDKDVAFLTMLGAQKPELPSYPEGSPLTEARSTK